jgi:hypothetical protein
MHAFLDAVEQSAFSTWVRESGSLWSYPSVVFLHTVGLAFLVGLNVAIDVRLLGIGKAIPVAPLARFFRVIWLGFWMNAVSGTILLAQDANARLANPAFYVKMLCVAGGVAVMVMMRRRVFGDPDLDTRHVTPTGKALAWASLLCWTGAITAGRLMAHVGASGAPPF